jgi:hypothetical protein
MSADINSANISSPEAGPIRPVWLWFGFTAAGAAWALNLWSSYVISGLICVVREGRIVAAPAILSRGVLAAVWIILLAVAASAGITSYRNWRGISGASHLLDSEGRERREFMALAGVIVSTALVVGLLWASIPLILVNICMRAR